MEYKGKKVMEYTNEDFNSLDQEEQIEFLWMLMDIALDEIYEEEEEADEFAEDEEIQALLDELLLLMENGEWEEDESTDEE